MNRLLVAAWRLTLALWVGGIAVFTFLLTPAIFAHYPRDEAGRIVGVLFPLYFPYLTGLSLLALVWYALLHPGFRRGLVGAAGVLLLVALAANGVNQFWTHPQSRALKAEIHFGEDLPAEHPARARFARRHGVSMALNLFVLADGLVLLLGGSRWWRVRERSRSG